MDKELLLDFYGFLPEKYFISRNLLKDSQTRVSFTDYERHHYRFRKPSRASKKWWEYKDEIIHQEYGPSIEDKIVIEYTKHNRTHRKNGPAIIFKQIQRPEEINRGGYRLYYCHGCKFRISEDKDQIIALKYIWYNEGYPVKCQGYTGENEVVLDVELIPRYE